MPKYNEMLKSKKSILTELIERKRRK